MVVESSVEWGFRDAVMDVFTVLEKIKGWKG